jgi:hypothetical protein
VRPRRLTERRPGLNGQTAPPPRTHWPVTHWVLLGTIGVAAAAQQIQVSWMARTVTNDDATLLWYRRRSGVPAKCVNLLPHAFVSGLAEC